MPSMRDRLLRVPPAAPPYVLEDTNCTRPVRLLRSFGIDWMAYPTAWIAPLWMVAVGILISFLVAPDSTVGSRLATGLVFAALIALSILLHYLGGALAGLLVRAPMRFIYFTATLAYCRYENARTYPSRVHLIRSLSQPAVHVILCLGASALYASGNASPFVLFLAILNAVFFVVAMSPLPTMHGGVLLKHLRNWTRG